MFEESDVFDCLGVTPELETDAPQEEQAGGTEPEAPASPHQDQGADDQARQDAAADVSDSPDSPASGQDDGQAGDQDVWEVQAQARVQQAVEQAVQAERQKQQDQMQSFFKRAGLTNTITGEAISSMEDFEKWEQAFQAERMQRELSEGRLSQETLERAISENPAVKQAAEIARRQQAEEMQRQQAEFEVRVQEELSEIKKIDPSVDSIEDIMRGANGRQFYDYVKRGLNYLDAFRLTHMDQLQRQAGQTAQQAAAKAAEAAKRQAQEMARSKDHLTGAGVIQGQGAAPVPPAEMALFRELIPGVTEAEAQRYYNQYERSVAR